MNRQSLIPQTPPTGNGGLFGGMQQPSYQGLLNMFTAPAQAYMAQPPAPPQTNSPLGNYLLGLHKQVDPVTAFGGYGGLAAMALPPGGATGIKTPWVIDKSANKALGHLFNAERKLPSGATFRTVNHKLPDGSISTAVDFFQGEGTSFGLPLKDMKKGISRLGEVADSLQQYVNNVKPSEITFTAATPKLQAVYDKAAPALSKRLGGELTSDGGVYTIKLPQPKIWGR